jgi:hypothetical protein
LPANEATQAYERRLSIEGMTPDMAQRIQHSRTIRNAREDYQRWPPALPAK